MIGKENSRKAVDIITFIVIVIAECLKTTTWCSAVTVMNQNMVSYSMCGCATSGFRRQ